MKRGGPPARKTGLRSRSVKAKGQDKARAECCAIVAERAEGRCEACPRWDPTAPPHAGEDVHEVVMRSSGGSITDPANCLLVCRRAHGWIHDHPKDATALGLLARKGRADD